MTKKNNFGFRDSGSSGGYQSESCNSGSMQSDANNMIEANDSAAKKTTKSQPNHVGGPYSGTK